MSVSFFETSCRAYYSTETALIHTLDKIYTAAYEGRPTVLVSFECVQLLVSLIIPFCLTDFSDLLLSLILLLLGSDVVCEYSHNIYCKFY